MNNKFTLVIGASENPDRYSFKAINMLRNHQQAVKAFGIKSGEIDSVQIDTTFDPSEKC